MLYLHNYNVFIDLSFQANSKWGRYHLIVKTFQNIIYLSFQARAVIAVIVWLLDLQLPVQSEPITTDVVSSNLDQGEVYNIMW